MASDRRAHCDTECPRYDAKIRTPVLFGVGPKDADILVVGEAPGQTEDLEGVPFIGESGRLLRDALKYHGIDPESVYITNAVKCATESINQTPNQKTIKLCRAHLIKEIERINPNVIAVFGAVALESVLKRKGITKLKNNIFYSNEFQAKVIPIYHPAYILRNPGALPDFTAGIKLLASEAGSKKTVRKSTIEKKHGDYTDRIDKILDKLEQTKAFVFDLETSSLNFKTAKILCVALSWKSGIGVTLKWDKLQKHQLYRFETILRDEKKLKINHNLKFDLEMLYGQNIRVNGPYFDTLIAASLINENAPEKGLDALTLSYLDIGEYWQPLEEEKAKICKSRKIKKDEFSYDMFDYNLLAEYAQWDADATFRLYKIFNEKLQDLLLDKYFSKYAMPTMELLVELECKGVLVDRNKLKKLIHEYQGKLATAHSSIRELPDVRRYELARKKKEVYKAEEKYYASDSLQNRYQSFDEYLSKNLKEKTWAFNQRSVQQLSEILFERLKLRPIKKSQKTNNPSTDKESLETYAAQGVQLCSRILEYRQLGKYIATYLVSTYNKSETDSRIHANYLQAKARTGRLCVDGLTLVHTDYGFIPISKIPDINKFIEIKALTQHLRYMPITHVWRKGKEEMFEVMTSNKKRLICTAGHQLFTDTGWKKVGDILAEKLKDPVHVITSHGKHSCYETERIVSVISVGDREVWDITVESDSSYFADGFLSHNSCVAPNMQNIPRDAKDFKQCLIADPGYTFVKADLKQAEFRCWAHYSRDPDMLHDLSLGSKEFDVHRKTAAEVFNVPEEEVTPEQRTAAKGCVFGLLFGRGAPALAEAFNITLEQAKSIKQSFFARYPVAEEWLQKQIVFAHKHGYVKTWLGRYRRLPEIRSDDPKLVAKAEREALNSPIQGLASNMNDYYMCMTNKLAKKNKIDAYPVATQHDAQIFLVKLGQEKRLIQLMKYVVEHAFPRFRAKMELDFEVGTTLGTLEPVK